jgi:arylsulfatase A-like enzyme
MIAGCPPAFRGFTDAQKRGVIAAYYTSVEYLDKNVGLVIDALKKQSIYDKTLIIYLGDQGYLLNDHKRFEKHTMWRESIQAPLIVAGKGLPRDTVYDQLIEFVDVVPTINEALGVAPQQEMQG